MEGRVFDAQVVLSPIDSSRGKLLSQYVCARIIRIDDVDLGLFDWDRHNTLYYFIAERGRADLSALRRPGLAVAPDAIWISTAWNWRSPRGSSCIAVSAGQAAEGRAPQVRSLRAISRCWLSGLSPATPASSAIWSPTIATCIASMTARSTASATCTARPISARSALISTCPKGLLVKRCRWRCSTGRHAARAIGSWH